jgi:hypothetical protein
LAGTLRVSDLIHAVAAPRYLFQRQLLNGTRVMSYGASTAR